MGKYRRRPVGLLATSLALMTAIPLASPAALVAAARRQIGVTKGDDPVYRLITYPGGATCRDPAASAPTSSSAPPRTPGGGPLAPGA